MSKKVAYIHIGINKTGSTSIQRFLCDNRQQLKTEGYLYPQTGRSKHAHHELASALGFGGEPASNEKELAGFGEAIELEVADSLCNKILISSEFFVRDCALKSVEDFFPGTM